MSRELLEQFAALLVSDSEACANLFTDDAEFATRAKETPVRLKGRKQIQEYLSHVPRHLEIRFDSCRQEEGVWRAEVEITGRKIATIRDIWRCACVGNRIVRFEVIPGEKNPKKSR